jgi:DNA modification methylase
MPAKVFRMSRTDANINCRVMPKMHPAEKPLALMSWCLTLAGDVASVVDPFMGSGTTLVACKMAGIRAVGIEINEEYCQKAVERLRQGVLPFAG